MSPTSKDKRFFSAMLFLGQDRKIVWLRRFFHYPRRPEAADLIALFGEEARKELGAAGVGELFVQIGLLFELPALPEPPDPATAMRNWRVSVDFVVKDLHYAASDVTGVFRWPHDPSGEVLTNMVQTVIADHLAPRGDGPDHASNAEILKVSVSETQAPRHSST